MAHTPETYSDTRLNQLVLDVPDMGNAMLAFFSTQAVAEICAGRTLYAAVLGAIGLSGFVGGQQALSKGLEHMSDHDVVSTATTGSEDKPGIASRLLERLRGIGYAVAWFGFVNELDGAVNRSNLLLGTSAVVAFAGIGLSVVGSALYPDQENAEQLDALVSETD